ncbi:MAG: hypothetical protein HKP58_16170 [Desulfatitalea sp.]|nr:hypothetical protein [Desulfatitalea sp.]NNK01949.1 hypothetical protein [Desulfatitalea sp.]
MSGFVAIIGNDDRDACKKMLAGIAHRGPDIWGTANMAPAVVGQNYLPADIGCPSEERPSVPLVSTQPAPRLMGYAGQIGNRPALCRELLVPEGPLQEERLLLALYSRFGTKMFDHLNDAIFAFIIVDENQNVLAARDLLGIKTLFYAKQGQTIYLGSEIKSLLPVTDQVYEFPAGHYMDQAGRFIPFASLPEQAPATRHEDPEACMAQVRHFITSSIEDRIDFFYPTGSLLSGGIDSSVIAMLASRRFKDKFGAQAQLPTFALGVGESQDIINARKVAQHIDSAHHELIIDFDQILAALDTTIFFLESFDPSLVRSAVSNYLISKYASEQGIEVLLSGEGGDEVFCGYMYLKQLPLAAQFKGQIDCLKFLHNNASLRLDHMNQCNQVRVVAPLICGPLLDYALAMAPELKQKPEGDEKVEKWIFRKTFENDLPKEVVWRLKAEFSQGSGSAGVLPNHFEQVIDDSSFENARQAFPLIRSKEEYYYFKIFTKHFGEGHAVKTVGQWITFR